jgi:adenine deaminase
MDVSRLRGIVEAAAGRRPCDLVLSGGRIVNVFSGRIEEGDLGIYAGHVVGIGRYEGKERIDAREKYLSPGFIDSHLHIESSCLVPSEFARGVIPRGTTTVIADPHEIANVMGTEGIVAMHRDALASPLDVRFVLPSCVPATDLETSGANLSAADLSGLIDEEWVAGLGEVMNFPGVIRGSNDLLEKILMAVRARKIVDGHAPLVSGHDLMAYTSAGARSDHECTGLAEATEKLARGMFVMIREGTSAKNLDDLIGLVDGKNFWFATFVGDDIGPREILNRGHVDYFLRRAVAAGIDPVTAVRMATIVPALRAGLGEVGALAPGRRADVVVLNDLTDFSVSHVFAAGRLVAKDGDATYERDAVGRMPRPTMHVAGLAKESFFVPHRSASARVIKVIEGQIITDELHLPLKREGKGAVPDTSRDILKVAVIERHRGTGNVAVGFVSGIGISSGALASSVGHDSHNVIVVGANDADMFAAAGRVIELGGGQVVVRDGTVVSEVALPVAGLMSDRPLREVNESIERNLAAAASLGASAENPFMVLSFLPLAVIPRLKITDRGLVDVTRFEIVGLYLD